MRSVFIVIFLSFINYVISSSLIPSNLISDLIPSNLNVDSNSNSNSNNLESFYNIDIRNLMDWSITDLLLASDIEGNLHALERDTGEIVWTIQNDGPLVQIQSSSNVELNNNDTWIVEPFGDGSLYFFNEEFGLNKLPTSIKRLVLESPFSLGDDKIYTGMRKSCLYSIDLNNGIIINKYDTVKNSIKTKPKDSNTILIGKTTYELTIHSQNNSLYNITYSSWGPNNIDNDLVLQNFKSSDGIYITPFHDKALLGINNLNNVAVWVSKMPNIAINVFDVFKSTESGEYIMLPHPLKPPQFHTKIDLGIFVDRTNGGSWYAMSGENYPTLVRSAPVSKYSINLKWNLPQPITSQDVLIDTITGVHRTYPKASSTFGLNSNPTKTVNNNIPAIIQNPQRITTSWLSLPSSSILSIDPPQYKTSERCFHFLVRIIEDLIITSIVGFILITLSKLGIIPPIMQLLAKFGFFKRTRVAVELAEKLLNDEKLENLSNSSISKQRNLTLANDAINGKVNENKESDKINIELNQKVAELNENKNTKKVTIVEPDEILENKANKKRKRGSRGGKRKKNGESTNDEQKINNLIISDTILGYGSHGTVVYKGNFENRPVAVKRMLLDFYDVASHEVSLLQESDDHPNVIRYYCSQQSEKFLYIAIELCSCTLEDIIEKSSQYPDLIKELEPNSILYQLASGLNYLHSLKIVHRDLKPQNILVSPKKKLSISSTSSAIKNDGDFKDSPIRMLISDFGLCKKLENDQSSFRATTANAAGTQGWRAPELLIDENDSIYNLVITNDSRNSQQSQSQPQSQQSQGSYHSEPLVIDSISKRRLTRAIDVFSLGCVFYYILTNGSHPFGDKYLREGNIIRGEYDISLLDNYQDSFEAKDLIKSMISRDAKLRPSTTKILAHPLFWSTGKKLDFLLKVSDRFEIEKRDPPSSLLLKLESVAENVIGGDWCIKFDKLFMDNLGKYRKYHSHKLMDLLRAFRNKYHHFNDLPKELNSQMSPLPFGFYNYFNEKFPNLLLEIYYVVKENLSEEHIFKPFF